MSEDLANHLMPTEHPTDAERFARLIIARGFRWAEVAQIEGVGLVDVLKRAATPDVQHNLNRLVTIGEGAKHPAGLRELEEFASTVMRDKSEKIEVRLVAARMLFERHKPRGNRKILAIRRAAMKQIAKEIIDVVPQ